MYHPFKPEIEAGEPTLRIGNRLPDGSVNLAFIDGPPLESENTVELFSYALSESGLSQVDFQSDFYVDSNRILRNKQDIAKVPIEDILITNLYKVDGEKEIPLWYTYTTRFYHYEVTPPTKADATGRVWYAGQNIEILHGETRVTDNFEIEIVETDTPNVYKVIVYSNFTASEDDFYYIKYSRCNADGSNRRYGFSELYNCTPYFTYVGSEPENIAAVVSAPPKERIFALEKLHNEDGYIIYVPENTDLVDRTPVLFRWRVQGLIKDSNGVVTKTYYSAWKSEPIFKKESLFEEDYFDYTGKPRYIDSGGIAVKTLANNTYLLLGAPADEILVEHEIWEDNKWVKDAGNIVAIDYNPSEDTITAYTTKSTGAVSRQPGLAEHSYRVHHTYMTIEGYLDPPVDEPAVMTNVAKKSKGASATTNCNYSHFPEHSIPEDAIDGYHGTVAKKFDILGILGVLNLGPIISDIISGIIIGSTSGKWYARSKESTDPPTTPTTTTVNFNGAKNINRVEVTMGEKGSISKLELLRNDGSATTIPITRSVTTSSHRTFIWESNPATEPIPNCTGVRVTVAPSKWKTRSAKYLLGLIKLSSAKYQTGFDIFEIDAYDYYDPDPLTWSRKVAIPITAKEDMPLKLRLYDIIKDNDLLPPEDLPKSDIYYKITFGDTTDPDLVCDYNPFVSFFFEKKQITWKGLLPITEYAPARPHEDGTFTLSYNDASTANVMPQVESSEVMFSQKFSATSYSGTNIYMVPFEDLNSDEMWLPQIHNGRMLIDNPAEKLRFEYYIPEYGAQCFYPDLPYMYSKQEPAEYIDNYTIRVSKTPMHVVCDESGAPTGEGGHYFLRVYTEALNGEPSYLPIINWNIFTGEIRLGRSITPQDTVYCDYYYKQEHYIYQGFYDHSSERFYYLDLNPMPGHVCTYPLPDPITGELAGVPEELPTWEVLNNKAVYLYIMPTFSYSLDFSKGEAPIPAEGAVLRHVITERDETPELPPGALLLGKIHLNNPVIPDIIKVTDCRRRGGGFKDTLSLDVIKQKHKEAESIWDIGTLDGRPYPSNGVIELTVPIEFKGREEEIKEIVKKWTAFGVYVFIKCE